MSSYQSMVTICSLTLTVTKIGLFFDFPPKVVIILCNTGQFHLFRHIIWRWWSLCMKGSQEEMQQLLCYRHVSVLCRYSIRRAERSSLSPALALYSTGSLLLSTRLISLPFSRPRRGNPILLIKQGAPGHGAQMQFVTISRSQDFDYTRALYADQRLLTTVNPPLKPIRSLLAPDHAHLRLSDPPTSLLCKKKKK